MTPNTSLKVLAPAPNSGVLVLPSTMAPAAFSRRTTSASSVGTLSLNSGEPKVVRMPAVGVMSLMTTGRPCSAPSLSPRITAASASFACSRAVLATSVTMALSLGLTRAMVARWASSTSTGLTVEVAISDANSTAVLRLRLSVILDFRYLPAQCTKRRSIVRNNRLRP